MSQVEEKKRDLPQKQDHSHDDIFLATGLALRTSFYTSFAFSQPGEVAVQRLCPYDTVWCFVTAQRPMGTMHTLILCATQKENRTLPIKLQHTNN